MKYTPVSLILLAGLSDAAPFPQFGLPGFSLPAFPMPTGTIGGAGGAGSGTGGGLPGLGGGLPGLGGGLPGLGSGGSAPSLGAGLPAPTGAATTGAAAAPTSAADAPASTGSAGGSGSNANNCAPAAGGAVGGLGGGTENGVTENKCCSDVTVIFARGTSEFGNMGTIAGPPMVASLRKKVGAERVTAQGVDYPADIAGNAALGAAGGPEMAKLVKTAKSQCPDTKIILSGYSQGGMVVHNAFTQGVSADDVAGAVMFGDPFKTQPIQGLGEGQVKEFCGTSDPVCGMGDNPAGSHLSYGSVADQAADFIIQAAGLS